MDEAKVIIFVTSGESRKDRVCKGVEWSDCWELDCNTYYAIKTDKGKFCKKKLQDLLNLLQSKKNKKKMTIWINTYNWQTSQKPRSQEDVYSDIKKILSKLSNLTFKPYEICIAYHDLRLTPPQNIGVKTWPYSLAIGQEELELWNTLSKLKDNEFEKNFDEVWDTIQKKTIIPNFSLLKHRIAHLWLPLDIDLQGIQEVSRQQAGSSSQEYLKNVLTGKDNQFYRQKLAKFQYVLAGEHVDFSQANGSIKCENGKIKECSQVKPQDKENLLVDNKSIYDLIRESDKKDVIDSQDWQALKLLSGLKLINGVDEKNPTNKTYKAINYKDSPIFQFICLMDCMISGECPSDVTKVLDPFDNWEVKNANPERITSFHSWFCALDDCLDKFREVFKSTAKG